MDWQGVGNGELLDRAEAAGFRLLIIADKNFRYQQSMRDRRIAILELWTNHRPTLENHFDRIGRAAETARAGSITILDGKD